MQTFLTALHYIIAFGAMVFWGLGMYFWWLLNYAPQPTRAQRRKRVFGSFIIMGLLALLARATAQTEAIADQTVRLLNGTMTDISLDGVSPISEAIPGTSIEASVTKLESLRFGQEVLEYGDRAAKVLSSLPLTTVQTLQAQPDGCLYLVPSFATKPVEQLPKQPEGLPICPVRRIDLT